MRFVALLRGIAPMNPNMRNEKLRGVAEGLGFTDVVSVISSGNLVLDAPTRSARRVEDQLEEAWPEQLGFTCTTIVRSATQLRGLIDRNPFGDLPDDPGARLQVTFLKHQPRPDILETHPPPPGLGEVIALEPGALFTRMNETPGTPDLMRWAETTFGTQISTRTWKTVHRIAAKL